jgi:hypothetical protein
MSAVKTVERLLSKGFPPNQLLHVIGEQAAQSVVGAAGHPPVRITDYMPSDDIQLIVGTVQVLPRLGLPTDTLLGLFMKSPLLVTVTT